MGAMRPGRVTDRWAWVRLAGAAIVGVSMGPALGLAWTASERAFLRPCIWCVMAPCPQWGCPTWRLTMLGLSLAVGVAGGVLVAGAAGRRGGLLGLVAMLDGVVIGTTLAMAAGVVPDMDATSTIREATVLARHVIGLAVPATVAYVATRRFRARARDRA